MPRVCQMVISISDGIYVSQLLNTSRSKNRSRAEDINNVIIEVTPAEIKMFGVLLPVMLCVKMTYSVYHHIPLLSCPTLLPQSFKENLEKTGYTKT